MATRKIEAAINAIPAKKESLRKAFDLLSSSSPPASFSLRWEDVEAHISSVESSINARFLELLAKEAAAPPPAEPESTVRPDLAFLCSNMKADRLRGLIAITGKDHNAIRRELVPALRLAPDPAKLVLGALGKATPPKCHACTHWMTYISLLECVPALVDAASIEPSVVEKAKQLAVKWMDEICDRKEEYGLTASAVLNLLVSYGLASEFEADKIIDVLSRASGCKKTMELCRALGLAERAPDLIDKLIERGKQEHAVRFVYAFNLSEKYATAPLLKAYVEKVVKAAEELKKGKYSEIKKKAISEKVFALEAVLRTIKIHNLESEYPPHILKGEIAKLKQYKNKMLAPAFKIPWKSKPQGLQHRQKQHNWKQQQKRLLSQHQKQRAKPWQQHKQQQQIPAKRHRPSPTPTSPSHAATRFLPAVQNTAPAAIPIVLGPIYDMDAPGSLYIPAGPPGVSGVQPVLIAPPPGSYQYLPDPSGGIGRRLR